MDAAWFNFYERVTDDFGTIVYRPHDSDWLVRNQLLWRGCFYEGCFERPEYGMVVEGTYGRAYRVDGILEHEHTAIWTLVSEPKKRKL